MGNTEFQVPGFSLWPSTDCWRHVGSEPVDRVSFSASVSLFFKKKFFLSLKKEENRVWIKLELDFLTYFQITQHIAEIRFGWPHEKLCEDGTVVQCYSTLTMLASILYQNTSICQASCIRTDAALLTQTSH